MYGGNDLKKELIHEAIEEAKKNALNNYQAGGPFGAIIEKNGEIIGRGHNTVIASKDPTAHAEINAIRMATQALGTHDLSECTLYVNAEPCPMCLSAIIWSNIKTVYFANTRKDAGEIGFRDDMIYDFIKSDNKDKEILNITHVDNPEAIKLFEDFKNNDKKIMY